MKAMGLYRCKQRKKIRVIEEKECVCRIFMNIGNAQMMKSTD